MKASEFMYNFDDAFVNGLNDGEDGFAPKWGDRLTILAYAQGYNEGIKGMGKNQIYVKYNDNGTVEFV